MNHLVPALLTSSSYHQSYFPRSCYLSSIKYLDADSYQTSKARFGAGVPSTSRPFAGHQDIAAGVQVGVLSSVFSQILLASSSLPAGSVGFGAGSSRGQLNHKGGSVSSSPLLFLQRCKGALKCHLFSLPITFFVQRLAS